MTPTIIARALPIFAALFGTMLLAIELGRRLGQARLARNDGKAAEGHGAMEGAVFGLMGLLLAFTFSHAASRFDDRRLLIVEEANDLGTAWLRLDLLPDSVQPAIRERFRGYVDMRLAAYQSVPDVALASARLDSAEAMQRGIWDLAVAGGRASPTPAVVQLLLPSLNAVFDIATSRRAAMQMHPPGVVFGLLGLLALICSLLAGLAMAGSPRRSWLHILAFTMLMVGAMYVTVDFEYPRLGMIRLDAFDQVLVNVRASMR